MGHAGLTRKEACSRRRDVGVGHEVHFALPVTASGVKTVPRRPRSLECMRKHAQTQTGDPKLEADPKTLRTPPLKSL